MRLDLGMVEKCEVVKSLDDLATESGKTRQEPQHKFRYPALWWCDAAPECGMGLAGFENSGKAGRGQQRGLAVPS